MLSKLDEKERRSVTFVVMTFLENESARSTVKSSM